MNRVQNWIMRATGISAQMEAMQAQLEKRGGYEVVLEAWESNRRSASGHVTPGQSLSVSAVWACVRVLSETLASLPLFMYERQADGKRRAPKHPLYELLHDQTNPLMTAFEFRETMQGSLALWGNAYAQLIYDDRGQITEMWPLRPDRVLQSQVRAGVRWYRYQQENGHTDWYSQDEIWHLRGLGGNGLDGYSPIGLMRRTIGLAMSAEQFGANFFENDARPGIVLEHPGRLGEKAYKNLADSWAEDHQGVENSHKPAILEEGMKLHEIGIPPEDAQFLETRQFQVTEIARIFRVPPHMIGDLDKATFSNIEQQSLEFVVHTIRPWLVRWEQSIRSNLMLSRDRGRYFPEFLVDGLLRGDIASRYQAYAVGRQNGWLSANDIRGLENMNAIQGGDVYLVPLNMVPADQVGAATGSAPAPGAPVSTARAADPGKEERSLKTASMRQRICKAHRSVIQDVAGRAMRREVHDVTEAIHKYMGKRDSGQLLIWLSDFYNEHTDWARRQYQPVLQAFGALIADGVVNELDMEPDDLSGIVERFMGRYSSTLAQSQARISQFRINEVLSQAQDAGADLETALTDEVEGWKDSRPAEIAQEQSIRAANAMARTVYIAAGVATLRWVTMGSESCPYCQKMNGQTVGINRSFLSAGEHLTVEGEEPLQVSTNIGHPPIHAGCECQITAA